MLGFYITCFLFVVLVLGTLLRVVTGLSIFKLMKYLGREYLLIVSTSSSETALPRLIAKLEHMGVSRPVVGITVPTGYSFNLDGTAIYLTMASLFIASALGSPLSVSEQISLLLFMMIASKGAAGRHRRRAGDPGRRPAGAPAGPGRRRRPDRRDRPVHVRGPRPDQLLGQRRGHPADRQVGRRDRQRPGQAGARRRRPVRRGHHDRRRPRRRQLAERPVAGHEGTAERVAEPTPVGAAR